jgi:hypothetical protein
MINIKQYEQLTEAKSSQAKQGYVTLIKAHNKETYYFYYYVGVADSFYEYAQAIVESLSGFPPDAEDFEDVGDVSDLMDTVSEYIEPQDYDYCFWHGLVPRSSQDVYEELTLDNVYQATQRLDELFTNAKDVMLQHPFGNDEDLVYIARSIETRPEAIKLYVDEPRFEKILNLTNFDSKKKSALITMAKTKGMI